MKKKILIIAFIGIFIFQNLFLSFVLTRLGNCKTEYITNTQVKLLTKCDNQTKYLMENILHAQAFVVDKNIFTYEEELTQRTMSHELAHVYQYKRLGPFFLPLYGISHIIAVIDSKIRGYSNIHAGNFFEIWANQIAGLPPEDKY